MLPLLLVALAADVESVERFPVHHEALPSGDTLVVVEDHRAPLVMVALRFPVGDFSPWFVERHLEQAWAMQMADSDGALRQAADALAVDLSLSSGSRNATVTLNCLAKDLEPALELLGEVLSNRDYARKELRRSAKGEELGWESDLKDPDAVFNMAAAEALFLEGDPRRRWAEGPRRTERSPRKLAAARDELLRLPGRWISFTGDIEPERARALSEGLLPEPMAAMPEGAEVSFVGLVPEEERPGLVERELPEMQQVVLGMVRPSLLWTDEGVPASLLTEHVLAGHKKSRLDGRIRELDGRTYGVSSGGGPGLSRVRYSIKLKTQVEGWEATEATLLEELTRFADEGLTAEELSEAVSWLLGSAAFQDQAPWGEAWAFLWEDQHDFERHFKRLARRAAAELTLEEVNGFAAEFYDPGRFVRIHVRPEGVEG